MNRRLSAPQWILAVSCAVIGPIAVAIWRSSDAAPIHWRRAILVGIAYMGFDLLILRLRIDSISVHNFVATEIPLLVGAVVLEPRVHLVVRMIAAIVATLIRRIRSKHRDRVLISLLNGAMAGLEVAVFLLVLQLCGWNGSIRWMGWVQIVGAWLGGALVGRAVAIGGRTLSGQRPDARQERRELTLFLSFSFTGLVAAGLIVAAAELDPFAIILISVLGAALVKPVRTFSQMWQRWSESSDLYGFADLLTHSSSGELEPVLRLAAKATKTSSAELILLERAGIDESNDAVLHATGEVHVSRPFEELPESWKSVLRTGNTFVRNDREGMAADELPMTRNEVVSALVVGQEPIGLLICSDQLDPNKTIEASDVEVAGILARHLGMWLEQDRLVAELRNEIQERTQQALHDPLTGLPNRRRFNEAMHEQLAGKEAFAIFVIDLDGFKGVNDLIGHESGDLILNRVSERLQRVMPKRALVARLGGDEFAVLLPGTRGALDADHLGRQIREELSIPHSFEDKSFEVEGSVGIALYPEHGTELAELLRNADAAMYAAKHSEGGPGVVVYGDRRAYVTSPAHRLIDAVKLKSAIEDRNIVAWYQPIVSLADCRVVGFEALARWEDNGKIITPDKFITLAEDTRVINQITELVMSNAFTDAMRWRTRFGRDFGMSVNLSPAGLADPHLASYLMNCLEATGLPPSAVTLEVTESRVMRDPQRSIALLERMKSLGVRLALDDFGTGQSSLQWLKKLPVDTLKIDRSFIIDLGVDSRSDGITEVTVLLGTKLGMNITAEGIETALQWNTVRDLGVDKAQGYLFAKPMPRNKVDEWLEVEEPYLAHTLALFGSLTPSAPSAER